MSLKLDPQTNKIMLHDRVVGEFGFEDGMSVVRLNIELKGTADDLIVPLSLFAIGLSKIDKRKQSDDDFTIETGEDSIEREFDVPRSLIEKIVKSSPYKWKFHKADADPWPSMLHGHDYEKGLTLDAITGEIYDAMTRQRCKTLHQKDLITVQETLRESCDFKDKVHTLIDAPNKRPKTAQ